MVSIKIKTLKELEKSAKELLNQFPGSRIFAFYGNMGAGKTTFIQALCKVLGSNDNVTSPTFALINEYQTPIDGSIFHFDFYRIKNLEEAFDLGYEDYLYSGSYCFIEWPEKIESILPANLVEVKIEIASDESRLITARLI